MDENASQKNSPAYRLAALDTDFLLGARDGARRVAVNIAKLPELLRH